MDEKASGAKGMAICTLRRRLLFRKSDSSPVAPFSSNGSTSIKLANLSGFLVFTSMK